MVDLHFIISVIIANFSLGLMINTKYNKKIVSLIFLLATILEIVLVKICFLNLNYTDLYALLAVTIVLVINLLVLCLILRIKYVKAVIFLSFYYFLLFTSSFFSFTFLKIINYVSRDLINEKLFLILDCVLSNAFLILIIMIIYKKCLTILKKVFISHKKNWIYFSLVLNVYNLLITLIGVYPHLYLSLNLEDIIILSLICFCYLFTYIIFINYQIYVIDFYSEKNEQEHLALMLDNLKKEYQTFINKIDRVKEVRHEEKHHLLTLEAFLNKDKIDEAKDYLKKMREDFENQNLAKYTNNFMIDSLLEFYKNAAEKKNIKIEYDIRIPRKIAFDDFDITIIVCNIIENAITASEDVNNDERLIHFELKYVNNMLFVSSYNSFKGNISFKDNTPLSTKAIASGYGSKIVRGVIDKYQGDISYEIKDNIFKISAFLNENDKN